MKSRFRAYLQGRGIAAAEIDFAVSAVMEFEEHLRQRSSSLEVANLETLKDYISLLIAEGRNSWERLVAIARYCNMAKKNDYYRYFASILGARNVLPDISARLAATAGEETRRTVFQGVTLPPLGAPQESYPRLTQQVLERMETNLPRETCQSILTWNYHKVPVEAFKEKKARFDQADNIDEYLKAEHQRLTEDLEQSMNAGRLWYEQEITPDVLEFVRDNQEICTGVRRGSTIYVTKIPYAPEQYLEATDPVLKGYYACHCPLVRSAIRDGAHVSPTFCYCSAGYEKLHFDVIFEQPVNVTVLESALNGDVRCRFANKIPGDKAK